MNEILLGKSDKPVHLLAKYGNRHGMVAGATGTGKTVSLLVIAEGFSRMGVPVFMADVKGDVAGLAMAGAKDERVARVARSDEGTRRRAVLFWICGLGHPVRTTVSDRPTLLERILD
jgi:DNA helicase HerA-like ATPase